MTSHMKTYLNGYLFKQPVNFLQYYLKIMHMQEVAQGVLHCKNIRATARSKIVLFLQFIWKSIRNISFCREKHFVSKQTVIKETWKSPMEANSFHKFHPVCNAEKHHQNVIISTWMIFWTSKSDVFDLCFPLILNLEDSKLINITIMMLWHLEFA